MNTEWIDVKDRLPEQTGWYIVYAPKYSGGTRESYGGIMFSKFIAAKNGNKSWTVESTGWNKGVVQYWMDMPKFPATCELASKPVEDNQMIFDFEK